jgi:hypothetical protein
MSILVASLSSTLVRVPLLPDGSPADQSNVSAALITSSRCQFSQVVDAACERISAKLQDA